MGIDVSKDKLDIKVLPSEKYYQIKNSKSSIKSFMKNKLLKLGAPELIVFEATGGYEKILMLSLMELKLPFHRAHPKRVYHFAKGKGYFAKTDKIDARILAKYGQQEEITADKINAVENLKRQEISARRLQIKEMIAQERNRLHAVYVNAQINRSIKRQIKQLEKELEILDKLREEALSKDENSNARRKLLQTIPGVGHEVATLMITDMPELGELNREQISNLVGVAPQTKDSGKKEGYRTISKGRRHVRKALYMSALVAMRHNPKLKPIYDKLVGKGKEPKVALVALMRKIIITMNAMVRDNKPWTLKTNLT
jgi:transposase